MEKVIQRQERTKERKDWEKPGKKGQGAQEGLGVGWSWAGAAAGTDSPGHRSSASHTQQCARCLLKRLLFERIKRDGLEEGSPEPPPKWDSPLSALE